MTKSLYQVFRILLTVSFLIFLFSSCQKQKDQPLPNNLQQKGLKLGPEFNLPKEIKPDSTFLGYKKHLSKSNYRILTGSSYRPVHQFYNSYLNEFLYTNQRNAYPENGYYGWYYMGISFYTYNTPTSRINVYDGNDNSLFVFKNPSNGIYLYYTNGPWAQNNGYVYQGRDLGGTDVNPDYSIQTPNQPLYIYYTQTGFYYTTNINAVSGNSYFSYVGIMCYVPK